MNISNFDGMSKLTRNMGKTERIFKKHLKKATRINAQKVVRETKKEAPVDFGILQKSIKYVVEGSGFHARVFPTVNYAAAVNNGSKRGLKANPFMQRGYNKSKDFVKKNYQNAMKSAVKEMFRK